MVASQIIDGNSTPKQLAVYVPTRIHDNKSVVFDYTARETQAVEELVSRYTRDLLLPSKSSKPVPMDKDQSVLLTGTTSSVGAYVLGQLISCPRVTHVVCRLEPRQG